MDQARAVRVVLEDMWNRQFFESWPEVMAHTFTFHIGGDTRPMTVAELRDIVGRWHEGFPDFHFDVHSVVASTDRAAAHATLSGTHSGPWGNVEATGRTIAIEHMFFFRFHAGVIVEVWELLDRSLLRSQLADSN